MENRECLSCGDSFKPRTSSSKYCSRKCSAESQRTQVPCECASCGKEFTVQPNVIKNGGGKYCSRKCSAEGQKTGEERACKACGEPFWTTPSKGRAYCSQECYAEGKISQVPCECDSCGKEFTTKPSEIKRGGGKYCSKKCQDIGRTLQVPRECAACGKEFTVRPSETKSGKGKYCSRKCSAEGQKTGEERACKACGEMFWATPSYDRDYCSQECRVIDLRVPCECASCGKEFTTTPSRIRNGQGKYCSLECSAQARVKYVGEDIPANVSASRRRNLAKKRNNLESGAKPLSDKVRESVFEKDSWRCHYCDQKTVRGVEAGKLQATVDHIVPVSDGGSDDPENLVTACRSCNSKKGTTGYAEYMASIGRLPLATT